jgi:hypothetical protein
MDFTFVAAGLRRQIHHRLLTLPSGAPRLPGADASARVFGRVAKMTLIARTGAAIHQTDGHAAIKSIKIGKAVCDFGGFLTWLVNLGLKIFGVL